MDKITRKAYAKINLGLDVLRRREDGYHEVRMIMQSVGLYDTLTFTRREEAGIVVVTDKEELPGDESNLIYKAAKLLTETYGIGQGVHIALEKRIPMAAGMAGGSTDAAAVFHGMNEMFSLGLSMEEMCVLAVKIGADVPYCIKGGTALAEGIGEVLSNLPGMPGCFLVIAKPDIDVSTKFVYENLHADRLEYHPDIDGMMDALGNKDLEGVAARLGNVLETVTAKKYPRVEEIKAFMKARGALNALMSGSGPTVFGIYDSKERAYETQEALEQAGLAKQVFVTDPVNEKR
ncbi:4-diphosphocytidyl-2-C-methyl-D-erythritol kinase [Kineothrix alysoides]|uniref:4-diphosphocytidyl-2-C-methyl-D-erythritol kinase n=1 Tax=Kineothrix alysoides TaxID=1469948 RepID=A0A4V2QCP4_9FIRM|nr:4-(cytidine 5'-diphospho)-2-C-methyl-D-erythritol kinase [Kineothrix alysoides]TCL61117.1 4-diphosphocytidyl-2-C-methyl-D-erythritol kinase [Kineothrix alysoides]